MVLDSQSHNYNYGLESKQSGSKGGLSTFENKEIKNNSPERKVKELMFEIKTYIQGDKLEDREKDILDGKKKELYQALLINPSKEQMFGDFSDYRMTNKESRDRFRSEFIQLIKTEYEKKGDVALSFLDPTAYDNCEVLDYYQGVGMTIEQIQMKILVLIELQTAGIKKMLEEKEINHYGNIRKLQSSLFFVNKVLQLVQDKHTKNQIFLKSKEFINTYPQATNLKAENKTKDSSLSRVFNVSMYSMEVNGITIYEKNNCGALLLFGLEANGYGTFEGKPELDIIAKQFDNTEVRIYNIGDKVYLYNTINNYKEVSIDEFNTKKESKQLRTYLKEMNIPWREEQKKVEEQKK